MKAGIIHSGIFCAALLLSACGGGGSSSTANNTATSASVISSSASSSSSAISTTSSALSSSVSSAANTAFAKGADISWITEMEAAGRKFYNKAGTEQDLLQILKAQGMNAIRLRVWVNPADGYNGMADVLAKAKRVQAAGMNLMIDFHYSDYWADPGKQTKPAAWANYDIDALNTALAEHTRNSLIILRDAGVTPSWVQVGNETNNGFLWEEGKASANMKNYARLTATGYDAVKDVFPNAKVIVHISNCHDNGLFRWIFDGLKNNGGKFDIIGASSYPTTNTGSSWQATNNACLSNLQDMVARYNVPVMIAEVGAPWDHADAKAILVDLLAKLRSIAGNQGVGVFYWEPQAFNNWKGYSLGAFDNSGKPGAQLDAFLE